MKCDIIIPVWNQLHFTKRCIESIQKKTSDYRIILIDNASGTDTRGYLEAIAASSGNIDLIRNEENIGFIKAVNQGLEKSRAPYICIMNNDTIAADGWLRRMIAVAQSDPVIGLVNPRSEPPGRLSVDEYSKRLSREGFGYVETNQCMGFCMLIKRPLLDRVGYLDEAYGLGGFDDTDFSRRAHLAGYKCVCAKGAYVYHRWHTSFEKAGNREALVRQNEGIYFNKWGRYLRIGYPIVDSGNADADINTSLGLAREWNWVHAWLNWSGNLRKTPVFSNLPEHQSLRLFKMPGARPLFCLGLLLRLIERRFKRKKPFDVILVSDRRLLKFLRACRCLFSFPVFYIGRVNGDIRNCNEEAWRQRARDIIKSVKNSIKEEGAR